jgi:prepilin peptidase CpaA
MPTLGYDIWAFCVLGVVLLVAAVTDVRTGKIYNWLTYPAVLIGLIGHGLCGYLACGGWEGALYGSAAIYDGNHELTSPPVMGLLSALGGLAVGFGPLLLAWMAGGIGGGDAKIMAAVGALAGWRFAMASMFCGFAVAIVMGLFILFRRQLMKETLTRMGRFVVLWLFKSQPGSPHGENSPTIPFGTALCIGSALMVILVAIYGPARTFPILVI